LFLEKQLTHLKVNKTNLPHVSIGDMRFHLELLEIQSSKGKVKNPRAYFIASIRDSFDLAQVFVHRAHQKAEKEVQEEIERINQAQKEQKEREDKEREQQYHLERKLAQFWIDGHETEFNEIIEQTKARREFKNKAMNSASFMNPTTLSDHYFYEVVKKQILSKLSITV
jgi:DNA anti-recombination protein RmuC